MRLAAETCALDQRRYEADFDDPKVRQMRQLAAWLMRKRAEVTTFDAAAALGVDPQFVTATVFMLSARFARSGARIDGPIADQARRVAQLLAPRAPIAVAMDLDEVFGLVAAAFRLSRAEMAAAGRARGTTRARQSFAWLASIVTVASPKEIGRMINRERTTVGYAVDVISGLPGTAALRDEVLTALSGPSVATEVLSDAVRRLELITRNPATALERLNP